MCTCISDEISSKVVVYTLYYTSSLWLLMMIICNKFKLYVCVNKTAFSLFAIICTKMSVISC